LFKTSMCTYQTHEVQHARLKLLLKHSRSNNNDIDRMRDREIKVNTVIHSGAL